MVNLPPLFHFLFLMVYDNNDKPTMVNDPRLPISVTHHHPQPPTNYDNVQHTMVNHLVGVLHDEDNVTPSPVCS